MNRKVETISEKLDVRNKNLLFIEKYKFMGDKNIKELYSNLSFMPSSIKDSIENIINETYSNIKPNTLIDQFEEIKLNLENID